MKDHNQTTHEARKRGPGARSKACSPVSPVPMAQRPSSFCITTLIVQLTRMSQSKL